MPVPASGFEFEHGRKTAILLDQCVRRALLNDLSVLQYEDPICLAGRGKPMGYGQNGVLARMPISRSEAP